MVPKTIHCKTENEVLFYIVRNGTDVTDTTKRTKRVTESLHILKSTM